MAKKRQDEPPKGSPAWMTTFSDLMNLLLTFFVLLFSMSSVDAGQFQMVVASLQSSFSILPNGGKTIGDGDMVGSGINQLEFFDVYYKEMANSQSEEEMEEENELKEEYKQNALEESENMAENIEDLASQYGIQDEVEVEFNAEYVMLNLNGTFLFDSGKADLKTEARPLIEKIGRILQSYDRHIIEVEGHTDNVPMSSGKYKDNNVLSMFRALTVADYIREVTTLNPAYIKSSGRGEYVPIADNGTPEGRARNRRVEIKIYNTYYSDLSE